jgi:hypothetical protein
MRYLKKLLLPIGVPLGIVFLLCDKPLQGLIIVLVGNIFLRIPYWFAWWLSDSAENLSVDAEYDEKCYPTFVSDCDPGIGLFCQAMKYRNGMKVHFPPKVYK